MKTTRTMMICGMAAALAASTGSVCAQTNTIDTPNGKISYVDTARQRYMQQAHDGMGFTTDADWNAVEPLVEQVFLAQRELSPGGGAILGSLGGHSLSTNLVAAPHGPRRSHFGPHNPELEALQKAIDNQASPDDIKAALTAYQASQKVKRAKLEEAQENLRKALTIQQEAQATLLKVLE